jgi:mono/diheme cytochrome c family protein
MIDPNQSPHDREHQDPDEHTHPLPRALLLLVALLVVWGGWYLARPENGARSGLGDQRTADALQGAPGGAVSGSQLFTGKCAGCHQATGLGVPGVFPPLAASPWVTESPTRLVQILLHGIQGPIEVRGVTYAGMMPSWKSLSDAEIAAVARYIRTAFGNAADTTQITTEFVTRVRAASAARTAPFAGGAELAGVP